MEKAPNVAGAGEGLPRKTFYGGSFVRLVEPGRHVYRTKLGFVRWFTISVGVAGGGGLAWETHNIALEPGFRTAGVLWFLAAMVALFAMILLAMAVVYAVSEARLEITREVVRFTKRGLLYGRKGQATWDVRKEFHTLTEEWPTFHVGGSTTIYLLKFWVEDGEFKQFGGGLDTESDSDRLMVDLVGSVELARDTTRPF